MPELPEVETMRRGAAEIIGSRVAGVERPRCKRRPILIQPAVPSLRKRLIDREIVDIGRVGKRVVLELDSDDRLVFEPRMTGLVLLADPPSAEHLRLRLLLDGGPAEQLLYWDRRGLGSVRLFSPRTFEAEFGNGKLGPDALTIAPEELQEMLGGSQREIKVALLDQRAVAGVGNLYAAEMLFVAGIHPQRRCHRLKGDEWQRLCEAMGAVLSEAIRYEGSTLSDGTYRNALNKRGRYQNHHRVYNREGDECSICRADTIRRIVQCQRSTFFCPTCQPKRRKPR